MSRSTRNSDKARRKFARAKIAEKRKRELAERTKVVILNMAAESALGERA
jgi:hypothetical protein